MWCCWPHGRFLILNVLILWFRCAIVSHPADVMVSKLNSNRQPGEGSGAAVSRIYKEIGFKGLWNGLPVRIVMIGMWIQQHNFPCTFDAVSWNKIDCTTKDVKANLTFYLGTLTVCIIPFLLNFHDCLHALRWIWFVSWYWNVCWCIVVGSSMDDLRLVQDLHGSSNDWRSCSASWAEVNLSCGWFPNAILIALELVAFGALYSDSWN